MDYKVTVENLHKKLYKVDKEIQDMGKLKSELEKAVLEKNLVTNEVEHLKSEASVNKATLKLHETDLKNANYKLERKQNDLQTKLSEFQEHKAVKS